MAHDPTETRGFGPLEIPLGRLEPGLVLRDRYRLEAELGHGGMGVVFRGTDLELGRQVAIKLLPEGTGSPEARQRLLREARAAAVLNHPRIVAVYDVGEDRGVPYFVMELVEGPTLGQIALQDLREVVDVGAQICDALEHAHTHGIIHRDLKPANVLIVGQASPRAIKLADLGLAVPAHGSDLTRSGTIAGTASYMAPEQVLGRPVDGRTDLYALGVVLYELTTGRPPFTGDNPLAVVSQHVHAPVVPPRALRSEISPALESVILRLLAKDPEQRLATAKDTAAALQSALESPASPLGEGAAAAAALLDALSRGRLVGRMAELSEVRELWHRARDGRGHCVLLSGEPGVGKTRLARELLIQAALDGAACLTGGCYEYEATTPYLPFVEAFRRWVREQEDDARLREILGDAAVPLARLVPEIEKRLGPFPARPDLPPHEERLLLFDAVAHALRSLSSNRGLLFYIDDLHWADGSTLWLLAHLLRQLREERVLIAASYRETELDRAHPLAKALVDWNRERLTTRIVLRRFEPEETQIQLGALLGESVSAEFAQAVHRETAGNPFFVEEVLKALIEQGSVRREKGSWSRAEVRELEIPQSMKAAIGNRLDRMSPECNEVLRAAAVLGKTFGFEELVVAAGELGEDALLDALDQAVAAQLIVADREESFAFTHDKIREVLYEEMNPIRRRRLHRRTAEGLERLRGRAPVAIETLAHHYIEAGDHERGLQYAKQAAAEAEKVFAYDEAIAAYGRALECAKALNLTDEQIGLEDSIGQACILRGDLVPASEHFERALSLATEPSLRARLQVRAAASLVSNGDPRGLEHLHSALAVLDPSTEPIETANALSIEARFHHLAGRHRRAIELLERAAALAAPVVDSPAATPFQALVLSTIYTYLTGAYQHLGLFEESNRWARRDLEFGEIRGILSAQASGYEFLGENAANTGHWEEGLVYAERERGIAARMHSRERRAWSHFYAGICATMLSRGERAEQELVDGISLAESIGERRLASLMVSSYAYLQADLGRLDDALQTAMSALESAELLKLLFCQSEARRALAYVRFRRGEYDLALELIDDLLELVGQTESRVSRLWVGPIHVEALLGLGRVDLARARWSEYAALVAQCQTPRCEREVARLQELLSAS